MDDIPDRTGALPGPEQRLADQLATDRPVPAAGFRGALGRHLADRDPGYGPRPPRLRLVAASWLCGGLLLMGLGALQATGAL